METTIKERLLAFITSKGVSVRKFEADAGLSNGYISNLRRSPTVEKMESILYKFPELSRSWLLTGQGEMLRDGVSTKKTVDDEKENKAYTIPLLPVSAQGGTLSNFAESVRESDCEKIISPIKGADFAMSVAGG